MRRHVIDPRPHWQRIVEEQGLVYPLTRYPDDSLRPYWDESAYYSFSLAEVEAMVAASEVGFEEKTQKVMDEFGKMVASNDKILFDDSKIDDELESLRAEIAAIPTSTPFIDQQKAKEKLDARLAEHHRDGQRPHHRAQTEALHLDAPDGVAERAPLAHAGSDVGIA